MPLLKVENLSKSFNQPVLQGINFEINKGEIVGVIGPSGAGKTTLLRCLALLESFEQGRIIFDDKFIVDRTAKEKEKEKLRQKIGVVFQDFNLWPHLTVLENVTEALVTVKKINKESAISVAKKWLAKVELTEKINEYPDNLSGGQKQRVAIARTLAMEPEVVLLDEITAALDPELAAGVLKIIKRLAGEGATMLIVTHQLRFAREISDRIIFIDRGQIVEAGTTDSVFENPRQDRTKAFIRQVMDKKQEINVYEGYDDFQAYHLGLLKRLKKNSTGYVVGAVGDRWFECLGAAYPKYARLLKEKNITWKWISYDLEDFEKQVRKDLGNNLRISLIPKKYLTPSNFNIWDDTIILQTFGEPPAIIEIKNENLVKGYLNYFNLLWGMGKKL